MLADRHPIDWISADKIRIYTSNLMLHTVMDTQPAMGVQRYLLINYRIMPQSFTNYQITRLWGKIWLSGIDSNGWILGTWVNEDILDE